MERPTGGRRKTKIHRRRIHRSTATKFERRRIRSGWLHFNPVNVHVASRHSIATRFAAAPCFGGRFRGRTKSPFAVYVQRMRKGTRVMTKGDPKRVVKEVTGEGVNNLPPPLQCMQTGRDHQPNARPVYLTLLKRSGLKRPRVEVISVTVHQLSRRNPQRLRYVI